MLQFDWAAIGYTVGTLVCGAISAIVAYSRGRKAAKPAVEPRPVPLEVVTQIDQRLHSLVQELRSVTAAARAHVYQFHNGGKFLDGQSMKKISCMHEACAPGVSHEQLYMQNLPISLFSTWMQLLLKNDAEPYRTADLPDSAFRSLLEQSCVTACLVLPIYRGGFCVAAIGLQFTDLKFMDNEVGVHLRRYARLVEVETAKEVVV